MIINFFNIKTYQNFSNFDLEYCCVLYYHEQYVVNGGKHSIVNMLKRIFLICSNKTVIFVDNLTFQGLLIIQNLPKSCLLHNTFLYDGSFVSLTLIYNNKLITFKCSVCFFSLKLKTKTFNFNSLNKFNLKSEKTQNNVTNFCRLETEHIQLILNKINHVLRYSHPG